MRLLLHALFSVLVLGFAGTAAATPMTLTFDTGFYDETVGGGPHGPYDWIEGGARIAGFWAVDVGTSGAYYEQGHTHPSAPRGVRGISEANHSWRDGLQGIQISLESGGHFDLISMDYRVLELDRPDDPYFGRLPWSFAVEDPRIVAAESFDPTLADFESQWTAFSVVADRAWHTVEFSGFDDVSLAMLTQTGHTMMFDNIVIDVYDAITPVPEPSTVLLMGLGLTLLAGQRSSDER